MAQRTTRRFPMTYKIIPLVASSPPLVKSRNQRIVKPLAGNEKKAAVGEKAIYRLAITINFK